MRDGKWCRAAGWNTIPLTSTILIYSLKKLSTLMTTIFLSTIQDRCIERVYVIQTRVEACYSIGYFFKFDF